MPSRIGGMRCLERKLANSKQPKQLESRADSSVTHYERAPICLDRQLMTTAPANWIVDLYWGSR